LTKNKDFSKQHFTTGDFPILNFLIINKGHRRRTAFLKDKGARNLAD